MSINEECRRFLARSKEGFDNPDFKHAQYLVDLLPELNSGNVSGKYQELEEKEKEVDNLVSKIVGNRFEEFASLLNKPMIYGEKYDNIKKIVSTSRKKIKHSKELLSKKNNNLKGYLFNSVHNKEILSVLEKVEKCNSLFIQIDALMKNESFYEMSLSILELRKELDSFDRSLRDCAVIKHLYENERYKTQEAFNLIQRFLRRFFFFFEYEFAIKSYASKADGGGFQFDKINLDTTSNLLNDNVSRKFFALNQTQTETFNDVLNSDYGVDLEGFKYFENKINQIRVVLQSTPKNYVFDYAEDEYLLVDPEVFENIHILKYINFSLEPKQFNKYLELICKAEDLLEQESFSSTKNLDIMNLFLAIRSAELSKILLQVFSDYYGNMKKNLHDSLLLVQMFLLKNVWASQKEEVVDNFQDNDESNASIYHNLTMVQDYPSLLSLTSLGDMTNEKIIAVEKRKDLLAVYNYNPTTTRNLIQLFKEILLFQTIFMRKNVMLQLMLTNLKESTSDLPIIHIRETWKEFILELDSLFDKVFMLAKIDFTLFSNPKDSHILFEASLIPGSPFYDELPKTKNANQIYNQGAKNSLLDDFMIQKFIDLMGVNFMYIPFVLSVIHKPIIYITHQITKIYEETPIKELFQSQQNNLHHHEMEIIAFFNENITKFLLLFKLEYVKLINGAINTNKPAALQPEKNMAPNQAAPAAGKNKPNPPKEETKKEEPNKEEKKDPEAPRESSRTTKTEAQRKESLEYQPVEKLPKRTKFDVKSAYLKLKYTITGLVQLSYNVNMLPSIAYYLPSDKGSHMLDLLTWSMNIAHLEISEHVKGFLKGYLVSDVLSDPRESEYMKCDPGLFKFAAYFNQFFPYLKYADQIPSMKDHMKFIKNKYRTYLGGETLINEEKLINNEKHIILIASVIENLEAFLKTCDFVFWNLLLKLPAQDILNVFAEKVSPVPVKQEGGKKGDSTKATEETKEAIARLKAKVETIGIQAFLSKFQAVLATVKEPANVYRQLPEETGELGIVRYFYRFSQIFETIKRCLICLKQELHLRAICHLIRQEKRAKITMENNPLELTGHNFTSLYRDVFAIFEPIKSGIGAEKLDFIFNDYLNIIVKIIKQAFLRSKKISRPYIKTYLQNIQSLEMNLKKLDVLHEVLEGKENPLLTMKRFLSLFLLEEKELLNIVKNKKKIKPKHIEVYVKLQSEANEIKLDQKQEMERIDALKKLEEIAKERQQDQSKVNPKV